MINRLYDFSSLEEVCSGDKDFINQMIELFKTNIPKEIEQIKKAIQNSEFDEVKKIAHKMKPSIGYVCVDSLLGEARLIEEWEGNNETLLDMVNSFVNRENEVIKQLQEI